MEQIPEHIFKKRMGTLSSPVALLSEISIMSFNTSEGVVHCNQNSGMCGSGTKFSSRVLGPISSAKLLPIVAK